MRTLKLIEGLGVGASGTAGQNGIFTVDAASSFAPTGAAIVTIGTASGSQGMLNIGATTSGALLNTGTGMFTINATGMFNVGMATGVTGTLIANGSVAINGGTLNVYGASVLTVAGGLTIGDGSLGVLVDPPAGMALNFTNAATVNNGSTILDVGTLAMTSALTNNSGAFCSAGQNKTATVIGASTDSGKFSSSARRPR